MVVLTVAIVLLAIFAVLVVLAGVKGFFVGAGEEIKRQHLVLKGLYKTFRQNLAKKKARNRSESGGGENAPDQDDTPHTT